MADKPDDKNLDPLPLQQMDKMSREDLLAVNCFYALMIKVMPKPIRRGTVLTAFIALDEIAEKHGEDRIVKLGLRGRELMYEHGKILQERN